VKTGRRRGRVGTAGLWIRLVGAVGLAIGSGESKSRAQVDCKPHRTALVRHLPVIGPGVQHLDPRCAEGRDISSGYRKAVRVRDGGDQPIGQR
jgi:hypothetical protein